MTEALSGPGWPVGPAGRVSEGSNVWGPSCLMRLVDWPGIRRGLGVLPGLAVKVFSAAWAYYLFILLGHLVEKGGKCLPALRTQCVNRLIVTTCICRHHTSTWLICTSLLQNQFQ